jgi:hypothetical protein
MTKRKKISSFGFLKQNYKTNKVGSKSDYFGLRVASTRLLTRIIIYLKEVKTQANYTTLRNELVVSNQCILDALNWLINNKIICKYPLANGSNRNMYYINPEWEKLKND